MRIKPETWYWVRLTSPGMYTEVLPALPYFNEHGEVIHWDSYLGRIGWEGHPEKVEPLVELVRPEDV